MPCRIVFPARARRDSKASSADRSSTSAARACPRTALEETTGRIRMTKRTRGFGGSEDGLEGRHAALGHRLEESDWLGEESSARRSGDPERGLALQFNRFRNSYATD